MSSPSASWVSVSISGSGQYQTALNNSSFIRGIYISSNYGVTWNRVVSSGVWKSVSLSSSGQYQTATLQNGSIYSSSNYGITWNQVASSPRNPSVSLSASGQYQTAVSDGGGIYTTSIPTTSQNNIAYNLYLTGATGQTGDAGNVNNTNNNIYCNNVYALSAVYANNVALTSDYRIKENVKPLDNQFQVDYLNPVTYTNKQTQKQDIGLIAHELQEIYPELVYGDKDAPEIQRINYIGLIPILINEIKNMKKEIQTLHTSSKIKPLNMNLEIETLKEKIKYIEEHI
jgi:hypothetical protein